MKKVVTRDQANTLERHRIFCEPRKRTMMYDGEKGRPCWRVQYPTTGELEEWIMQDTGLKWQEIVWPILADGFGLDIESYEHKIDFLVDLCVKMKGGE